jgi:hypothetical protein
MACVREAAAGRPRVAGEEAVAFGRSGLTRRRHGSLRRGAAGRVPWRGSRHRQDPDGDGARSLRGSRTGMAAELPGGPGKVGGGEEEQ